MLEQEQLENLKKDPVVINFNKPVDITIRSPTGIIMLHIKSNSYDLTQYNIEIFSDNGTEFHSIPNTINNLSIQNVINIVNSVPPKFQFHAALLKSLGDLIPYQTVCLQAALVNNVTDVSVMGSIDYSMIFQLLGNVTYRKNGKDVTCELNQRRILTGVNMENTNIYFPWSSTEKHVYQLLLYIYGFKIDGGYEIDEFKRIRDNISKILYDYTYKHNLTSFDVINFFMNICIADLNECTQLIQKYPDSDNLIQNLEMSIQPLTNITNFKIEHITSYIQNKTKDNEILKDDEFRVNFDNLDYILAYIIARQSMLPTPTVFNLPNIQGKPTSSNDTHTRKRPRTGGKRKKTLRKK